MIAHPAHVTPATDHDVLAVEAIGLGRRFGRRWALQDCTLRIPTGRVIGLVGANGAGKTTLLHMLVGLLTPSAGTVRVLGDRPARGPDQLARVGFLAQEIPLYGSLTVRDHLRLGERLNRLWDAAAANDRIASLGLDGDQRAGQLSGGQRAQLALTLAMAKRPDVLLLDEPVAGLDPLARREFLQTLMADVATHKITVILSSHLLGDIERVCDYLVVLAASRVLLAGDVAELLADHRVLTGTPRDKGALPAGVELISSHSAERQATMVVRGGTAVHDPAWTVEEIGLEELVLAYLEQRSEAPSRPKEEVG